MEVASPPDSAQKLDLWEDGFTKAYSSASVRDYSEFFDYWLKLFEYGIMETAPIRVGVRTGNGASFIQEEQDWPSARTEYTRWVLDTTCQDFPGNSWRDDHFELSSPSVKETHEASYTADVKLVESRTLRASLPNLSNGALPVSASSTTFWKKTSSWQIMARSNSGCRSAPRTWISSPPFVSSTKTIASQPCRSYPHGQFPIASRIMKGRLKLSHRKIDTARSAHYADKHTHLKANCAPLKPHDIVPVEIEVSPITTYARKGGSNPIRSPTSRRSGPRRESPRVQRDLSYRYGQQSLYRWSVRLLGSAADSATPPSSGGRAGCGHAPLQETGERRRWSGYHGVL